MSARHGRFGDVHSKIEDAKEFVVAESDKVNVSLVQFQHRYESLLQQLDEKVAGRRAAFCGQSDARFADAEAQMAACEAEVCRERDDRVRENEAFQQKLHAAIESELG